MNNPSISIILPAHNEEHRLGPFLQSVIDYAKKAANNIEIIIVDDASQDKTFKLANSFKQQYEQLQVIQLKESRGKGAAVKFGLMRAKGDIVGFTDADGSTPINTIDNFLPYFQQQYDIVIGNRTVDGQQHRIKTNFFRKNLGKLFNALVHLILFKKIQDPKCGFKFFKKDIIKPLFSRMYINGYGFDLEILFLAYKMGYEIKEIPVQWQHIKGSKYRVVIDTLRLFVNILQVRNWHFTPINLNDEHMCAKEIEYMYRMEKYHWWFCSKNELVNQLIINTKRSFNKVLDAGCGTGLNLTYLYKYGKSFGCDIGQRALSFCRKNNISKLTRCNLESNCFKERSFDLITSLDVIEHIENPESVVRELNRILTDDGTLIITVPAFKFLWSQHDDALSHKRRYQRRDLQMLLTENGFEIEKMGYFFFLSFFIVAPIRLTRRLFVNKGESKSDTTTLPPMFLNKLMIGLFKLEARLTKNLRFPLGTTLYAVIRKTEHLPATELTQITPALSAKN